MLVAVADNIAVQTVTRQDVQSLWVFAGVALAFIVLLLVGIFWYRHRVRDEASFNDGRGS